MSVLGQVAGPRADRQLHSSCIADLQQVLQTLDLGIERRSQWIRGDRDLGDPHQLGQPGDLAECLDVDGLLETKRHRRQSRCRPVLGDEPLEVGHHLRWLQMIAVLIQPELDPGVAVISQQAAGFQEGKITQAAGGDGDVHAKCSLSRQFQADHARWARGNLVRSQRFRKIDGLEHLSGFVRFSAFCGLKGPRRPIRNLRRAACQSLQPVLRPWGLPEDEDSNCPGPGGLPECFAGGWLPESSRHREGPGPESSHDRSPVRTD